MPKTGSLGGHELQEKNSGLSQGMPLVARNLASSELIRPRVGLDTTQQNCLTYRKAAKFHPNRLAGERYAGERCVQENGAMVRPPLRC